MGRMMRGIGVFSMKCVPLTVAVALALLAALPCQAIGTRTHAEIGMMCVEEYLLGADAMLPGLGTMFKPMENRRILYRACAFPDWGYGGINPDAGEASHWHPFNRAWADLLGERGYAMPPDAEGQQELAYFLGAVCHDIADTPWHFNYGNHKSFLQMANDMDQASHGAAEIGSDFVRYTQHPFRHISYLSNWVPFDTITAVMKRANIKVTSEQLRAGITREHLIMWFGPLVGQFYASEERAALPWCMAHLEDYYYGGMRHNAAACAMWCRYWYADITGGQCLQQMPMYFDNVAKDSGYVPYLGTADTTLLERAPANNLGQESLLQVGGPVGNRRAALVRFDLTDVPKDAKFGKATLWLASAGPVDGVAGPVPMAIHAAPGSWQEGGGVSDPYNGMEGRPATPGEAAWTAFPPEGGDPVARGSLENSAAHQWVSFDVTALVNSWRTNPESNHGFMIRGVSDAAATLFSAQAFQADSSGYCGGTRVAYRPMLILLP
jgi:hypothetical protein